MGFGFTGKRKRMDLALEKGNKRTKWETRSAGGAEESTWKLQVCEVERL